MKMSSKWIEIFKKASNYFKKASNQFKKGPSSLKISLKCNAFLKKVSHSQKASPPPFMEK
jgi:hypothetical protein